MSYTFKVFPDNTRLIKIENNKYPKEDMIFPHGKDVTVTIYRKKSGLGNNLKIKGRFDNGTFIEGDISLYNFKDGGKDIKLHYDNESLKKLPELYKDQIESNIKKLSTLSTKQLFYADRGETFKSPDPAFKGFDFTLTEKHHIKYVNPKYNKSFKYPKFLNLYFRGIQTNGIYSYTNSKLKEIASDKKNKHYEIRFLDRSNFVLNPEDIKKDKVLIDLVSVYEHRFLIVKYKDFAVIVDNGSLTKEEKDKIQKDLKENGYNDIRSLKTNIVDGILPERNGKFFERGDCVIQAAGFALWLGNKLKEMPKNGKNTEKLLKDCLRKTRDFDPYIEIIKHYAEKEMKEGTLKIDEEGFVNISGLFSASINFKKLGEAIKKGEDVPEFLKDVHKYLKKKEVGVELNCLRNEETFSYFNNRYLVTEQLPCPKYVDRESLERGFYRI